MENNIVSVERVKEYADTPKEVSIQLLKYALFIPTDSAPCKILADHVCSAGGLDSGEQIPPSNLASNWHH